MSNILKWNENGFKGIDDKYSKEIIHERNENKAKDEVK